MKIIQFGLIALSLSTATAYGWEWPWVDQEKRASEFVNKFEKEIVEGSATDFYKNNDEKIKKLKKRLSLPSNDFISANRVPSIDFRGYIELNRLNKIQKTMDTSGLEIVSNNMDKLQEGPLNGLNKITTKEDRYELNKIIDQHIIDFKHELDSKYGAGTADHYWHKIQWKRIEKRDDEVKK